MTEKQFWFELGKSYEQARVELVRCLAPILPAQPQLEDMFRAIPEVIWDELSPTPPTEPLDADFLRLARKKLNLEWRWQLAAVAEYELPIPPSFLFDELRNSYVVALFVWERDLEDGGTELAFSWYVAYVYACRDRGPRPWEADPCFDGRNFLDPLPEKASYGQVWLSKHF